MIQILIAAILFIAQPVFCMEGSDISQANKNDQLKEAVLQKRPNDVEHWLKLGADANNTYPIAFGQASMLLIAINNEDMESVTHLLKHGANPSSLLEKEGFLRCLRMRKLHKMIELMQQYRRG